MIMPILTIQQGMGIIPSELLHPAFSRLETYMRGRFASISLDELVDDTLCSIKNATCTNKRRNEQ
jgi:hypothetical protein